MHRVAPCSFFNKQIPQVSASAVTMAGDDVGMDSNKLTDRQVADLKRIIWRQLNFLTRLQRRMEQLKFTPRDEIYLATMAAQDAVQALSVKLHYLSCKGGVGRMHDRD